MSTKSPTCTIIITPNDEAMLADISSEFPLVSRHRIAQVALRCGLRVLRRDPPRLVTEARDVSTDDDATDAAAVAK
jgi:hypothetical protein